MATRPAKQTFPTPSIDPRLAPIERLLNETPPGETALVGPRGERTPIPDLLYEVLREAVAVLSSGQGASVVSVDSALTTQQAADLLNVSRPFLIKLLDRGDIAYRFSGTHRRIALQEVLRYRAERSAVRRRILNEMAREAEDLGILMD